MVSALKSFIVREELSAAHAERFLLYMDRFNAEVFLDLKKHVEEEWKKIITELSKSYKPSEEITQAALLKNPKATTEIQLITNIDKLATSRSSTPIEVAPSVKIPLVYSKDERPLFVKRLMVGAARAMRSTVHDWSEIFKIEKKGRSQPWFKIVEEADEVRLQLALNQGIEESYKTLYSVRVEHGKPGSKLRDHDRVYLITLV